MEEGTVKFFNETKGFGFIKTESGDVFCHIGQRAREETNVPKTGDAIFFKRAHAAKGPMATEWKLSLSLAAPAFDIEREIEQDRRDGYRPGVIIALSYRCANEFMLGRQRGFWTWAHAAIHSNVHDAKPWQYAWGVPQGGIEPGESWRDAIPRELGEELGPDWPKCIVGEPTYLFKERQTFRVEKDGKVYKGKSLYAFLVKIEGPPEDCFDFMYGRHEDEFWTLPTPGFPGGIQFYKPDTAREMIAATQQGPKGKQLTKLLDLAQAA